VQYYDHYKNLNKIMDQNLFTATVSSTYTTLLDKSTKLNLMPCKLGIVQPHRKQESISLRNQKLGDSYIQMLSDGLVTQQIKSYDLRGTFRD